MKYIILLLLFIIGLSYYNAYIYEKKIKLAKIEILKDKKINIITNTYAKNKEIKHNVNLIVDFFPQSPFGKWGPIFNDTCEEASSLIAINYIRDNKMSRTEFRDELLKIVNFEKKYFGYYKHTNINETSEILKKYFKFSNFYILDNPTINRMKSILNNGNIIIAPFYGIGLNPNYTGKGPEYHFMVIKGYSKYDFITHDVGTKYGKNYHYNQKILLNRLHDYNDISIKKGEKKIIVLKK